MQDKEELSHRTLQESQVELIVKVMDGQQMSTTDAIITIQRQAEHEEEREIYPNSSNEVSSHSAYSIRVCKPGYQTMQQTVLVEEENITLNLPIFPLTMFSVDSMYILVVATTNQLVTINSDNQHSTLGSHDTGCVSLLVHSTDPNMRLYAELEFEDKQARCYVLLNQTVNSFQVPEHPKNERIWDLGFMLPRMAQFIEVNSVSCLLDIEHKTALGIYEELVKFIRNSKSVDMKTILGTSTTHYSTLRLQGTLRRRHQHHHRGHVGLPGQVWLRGGQY